MKQRILAMDGGTTGYVTAEILRRTAKKVGAETGHFLQHADILAGTSAGALNALFLAAHDDPDAAIEEVQDFWAHILETSFTVEPARLFSGMFGAKALGSRDHMLKYLIDYFGEDTRLRDLKQKVIITAFELSHMREGARHPKWRPRLFHNIEGLTDYSPDERVVDVAMRTSNLPIVSPIYSGLKGGDTGYLDGGLVANNPSMCAVSAVLEQHRNSNGLPDTDVLSVLSIGCGNEPLSLNPDFVKSEADWGYWQWLLSPQKPMLLVRIAVRGATDMIDYQCSQLLGENFKRIDPELHASPHPFDVETTKNVIRRILEGAELDNAVDDTVEWLQRIGWVTTNIPSDSIRPAPMPPGGYKTNIVT